MAKKSPPQETAAEDPDLLDQIRDSSSFQWLVENRQHLPYIFVAVLALLFLTFKFTSGRISEAESNYLLAENYFTILKKSIREEDDPEKTLNALENLKKITINYPELQSRYDGLIAQLLLAQGNQEQAQEFSLRTLNRTDKDQLSPYTHFTRTSLLIGEKNYQKAIEEATLLKGKLEQEAQANMTREERNFGDVLYAYNLLRIAMLQKAMGNSKKELLAWKEWKQYTKTNQQAQTDQLFHSNAFASLGKKIDEGSFSLSDFIDAREKTLGSALNN